MVAAQQTLAEAYPGRHLLGLGLGGVSQLEAMRTYLDRMDGIALVTPKPEFQPVRVLSTGEEGRLAYAGAVATVDVALPRTVAVCDVGGASTEIAAGSRDGSPAWVTSVDLGSVRLTARAEDLDHARAEAREAFVDVVAPPVELALAVGGSARATRRLVGAWLGEGELAEALRLVEMLDARAIARRFGVDRARARILPAGVAILAEVQHRLGVPLHVCDGGIREGAVLATVAALAA